MGHGGMGMSPGGAGMNHGGMGMGRGSGPATAGHGYYGHGHNGGHYYGGHYYHGHYHGGVNFYVGGYGYPYYYGYPYFGFGYPYGYAYAPYYGYSAAYTYDPQGVYQGRVVNPRNNQRHEEVDPKDQSSVEARVQEQLAQGGYYHGEIDGVVGDGTRRAIRSYERANGLQVDGRIDDQLLSTMGLG